MKINDAKKCLNKRIEGAHVFLVFHYDPIRKDIEVREGYFPSYGEGSMWAKDVTEFYNKHRIPYAWYTDGIHEESKGNLETGKWKIVDSE